MPTLLPDTTETLVFTLGLALGLTGFLVGVILIVTGTCLSSTPRCAGPGSLVGRKADDSAWD